MAQDTTSPASASSHHQVFINHHGRDVKNTFARHLYRSLKSRGLEVFLDQPELQAGQRFPSQIEAAIQFASVQIAIFSKNYAKSKWCLDELCLMVDSEKRKPAIILPVFYKVKPQHLRWTGTDQDGPYAKALRKHEEKQRYDSLRIQSWREALAHVSDITGFELEACNGNEADLLDRVVQRVLTVVPKPALHVAKYATGLGEKIKDFEKTVLFQQELQPVEAKVVGIAGAGGVGKTTLASEFFNVKRSHYDVCSFLPDVREKAAASSLNYLQSKLIKDLKSINKEIGRWQEGIGILQTNLSSCHALVILDDVDDADQLDAFLPIKSILDPKSLILVTSRDKHVLRSVGIAKSSIYHLKGLNDPHSKELFCRHAFFQPHPRPGFENLVAGFVKGCAGLPLSLKVFGALLCEKDQPFWEDKLKDLQKLPKKLPQKILASLKISYDSLDQEQKQIFLDIACFAIGEEKDKWVSIWGSLAGLQTLEERCLVEVDSENTMKMHDHLRDMGRNIAEEASMPLRLWRIRDVYDLFEEQSSSSVRPEVRGIKIPRRRTCDSEDLLVRSKLEIALRKSSSQEAFKIRKLQLLDIEGEFLHGVLTRVRSPNLTWLRWSDCPYSSLPSWLPMDHLKVLEVEGQELKKLWECESQAPLQLRELKVQALLSEFPKFIGKLEYLQKIVLRNDVHFGPETLDLVLPEEISHVCSLKYLEIKAYRGISLPNDIGNLTDLEYISLSSCQKMRKLPESLKNLTNLKHIDLYGCSILKKLPNSLGNLTNLQHIGLSHCALLKKLPDSFTDLTNLQDINLDGCYRLKRLPKSFGNLTNLKHINMSECYSLKKLPNSLGDLTNLQRIELYWCKSMKKLPNSLGDLTNLQRIELKGCKSMEVLPDSFGKLSNLQYIQVSDCEGLKKLPDSFTDLTNLQDIKLYNCNRLKRLPKSFGNLTNLKHINLFECKSLKKLPNSFGNLTNLQRIELRGCKSVEGLPDSFGKLSNLQYIELSGWEGLKKLPDSFTDLTNLQDINLYNCNKLKRLPKSFGNLTNLKHIFLFECNSLKKLPNSLGDLTNLQIIELQRCKCLEVFPDSFGKLSNLQKIQVSWLERLKKLPDSFTDLTNLQGINLYYCNRLKRLPKSFGNLTNLKHIKLYECKSLKKLPNSLGDLTNLEGIELHGCESVEVLPDSLWHLTNLTSLDLSRCNGIKKLPKSLGELTNLRSIDLSGHKRLKKLPKLCEQVKHQKRLETLNLLGTNLKEWNNAHTVGLSNLKILYLGSPLLKELPPSFGCLASLKILVLHGCQELKHLPESVGTLSHLTVLEISECGIHELAGLMKMNNLHSLRVRRCPLRKLPFQEESAPAGRKRKRRAKDKVLAGLNTLELYCTEISEVSFPEGVCINLRVLDIRRCNNLVEVGSLPAKVERLNLRGCSALRKIGGLCGVAKLERLDIRGCYNIQVEELPHFGSSTYILNPGDTHGSVQEEEIEKEMADLHDGVLPVHLSVHLSMLMEYGAVVPYL